VRVGSRTKRGLGFELPLAVRRWFSSGGRKLWLTLFFWGCLVTRKCEVIKLFNNTTRASIGSYARFATVGGSGVTFARNPDSGSVTTSGVLPALFAGPYHGSYALSWNESSPYYARKADGKLVSYFYGYHDSDSAEAAYLRTSRDPYWVGLGASVGGIYFNSSVRSLLSDIVEH